MREPVSKFASGLFELAKRGNDCVLGAGKGREGSELALAVLDACVCVQGPQTPEFDLLGATDPHLKLQVNFLLVCTWFPAPSRISIRLTSTVQYSPENLRDLAKS